ncbi:hypothetical protein CMV_019649 [Castanea mollissima]|uniref:Uncharacterized protein n=1 Tax=Castanea mollissima TaxID=60419 RepID=A0A8J4VB88_9ROSI|nr:hypothetical protein CMV_019649 [Castanea mollissima]
MIRLRFLVLTTKHACVSEKAVGCLDSLRFLAICECENLKCLLEGMEGHLTNLRTLIVFRCPSLTSLSLNIKHLTALETMMIGDCEELSLTEMEGEDNQDFKLSLQKFMIREKKIRTRLLMYHRFISEGPGSQYKKKIASASKDEELNIAQFKVTSSFHNLVYNNLNITVHFNTETIDIVSNTKGQTSRKLLQNLCLWQRGYFMVLVIHRIANC